MKTNKQTIKMNQSVDGEGKTVPLSTKTSLAKFPSSLYQAVVFLCEMPPHRFFAEGALRCTQGPHYGCKDSFPSKMVGIAVLIFIF